MRILKTGTLLFTLILLSASAAMAHALFIKVAPQANPGEPHLVQVYYAEPDQKEVEPTEKWYSDVASFKLWLITPDGSRNELKTETKTDHVAATFTPEEEGVYRLEIGHTAADPADGTAYQFNAFAQVLAGKAKAEARPHAKSPDLVVLKETSAKGRQSFGVYFKGKPASGIETTVFFPDGESKTFHSNESGKIDVPVKMAGEYTIEATLYREGETGTTSKVEYQNIWRCATQKINVK